MTTKVEQRSYEEALNWLRDHGFDCGSLGRVSEAYESDRMEDRDRRKAERGKRRWEVAGVVPTTGSRKKGRAWPFVAPASRRQRWPYSRPRRTYAANLATIHRFH